MSEDTDTASNTTLHDISFDEDALKEKPEDVSQDADGPDADDKSGAAEGDAPSEPAEGDGDEGGDEDANKAEELGAFDPEDADSVAKYDAAYLKDGQLDLEGALTAKFWANKEAGKEGLDDGDYAYLATKGISKGTVKAIEAMAETNKEAAKSSVEKQDLELFTIAADDKGENGPKRLQDALKWGKDGAYNADQQKRFNEVMNGKDFEAKKEAVELLINRWAKANPPPRPSLPGRDATKGQGKTAPSVKPFASRKEADAARKALKDSGADIKGPAWAEYNRRRAATKLTD